MIAPTPKRGVCARPSDPRAWVRARKPSPTRPSGVGVSAHLTIDVTRALRGRIKGAAFQRGLTVAGRLLSALGRASPEEDASAP